MFRITRLFVFAILLIGIVLPGQAQQEPEPETLLLTFIPNIQFAPFYVGIAEGHFEEAGYLVTLEYLNEPDVVDLVAAGQARFGVVSGEQIIQASVQGRPIVYVYQWFQQYPIGVAASADFQLSTMQDLSGAPVGIPGRFGASYTGLTALLQQAGMAETDIQLEEIGFNAPEVFCLGVVQAAVVYINNEPQQIRNRADTGQCGDVEEVQVLVLADSVPLVSNGLITSQMVRETQPEKVAAFVAAFDVALSSTISNPARAYLLSAPSIPGLPLDDALRAELENLAEEQDGFLMTSPDAEAVRASREAMLAQLSDQFPADTVLQFEILLATIELWESETLGYSSREGWENMLATLQALNLIQTDVDVADLYTNAYVPGYVDGAED